MSYLSDVVAAFHRKDWDTIAMDTIGNSEFLHYAERYEDENYVILRWSQFNHWQDTKICKDLRKLAKTLSMDYIEIGEGSFDKAYKPIRNIDIVERYEGYARFPNEVGLSALDDIARNLVKLLLDKGVSLEEIEEAASLYYPHCGSQAQIRKYAEYWSKKKK